MYKGEGQIPWKIPFGVCITCFEILIRMIDGKRNYNHLVESIVMSVKRLNIKEKFRFELAIDPDFHMPVEIF